MYRLVMLAVVVLLASLPPFFSGELASSQESTPAEGQEAPVPESEIAPDFRLGPNHGPWAEVARPLPRVGQATSFNGSALQSYDVYFNMQHAAVPPVDDAEFMVVELVSGTFALEVGSGTFVVDRPDGTAIEFMEVFNDAPYYELTGSYVRDVAGNVCTRMCAIPVRTAVQLQPGDTAIALADSLCIWCLLNQPGATKHEGLMLVSVKLEHPGSVNQDDLNRFSWIQDWDDSQATPTPTSATSVQLAMAWAFFNPQARCRSGGDERR